MLPVTLSIIACFGWGIADYIGGFKSRTLPILGILFISTFTGVILLMLVTFGMGVPLPRDANLFWAVPAGPIGLAAMYLLYKSLSVGTMSVLAPISATGVIMPVVWGLVCGDAMSGLSFVGIAIAIFGSLLAVMEKTPGQETKQLTRGVGLAVGSAFFVGLYFIFMDTASTHHPVWASLIMRSTTLVSLIPALLVTRTAIKMGRGSFLTILFMGMADTLAAFSFALATSNGMLSQVAVISAMYPVITVSLSTWFLRERMAGTQAAGVFFAITGVVLISAF